MSRRQNQSFSSSSSASDRGFLAPFRLPAREMNAALMDFGSSICTGRPKCGNCPLSAHCVYFKNSGADEMRSKKYEVRNTGENLEKKVSWKNARVFLWLHENHKKYYSAKKQCFTVFMIPPSHNTRAGIKDFFCEHYNLELSVRPPHQKRVIEGIPTLFVNAQILAGTPDFSVFAPDCRATARRVDGHRT